MQQLYGERGWANTSSCLSVPWHILSKQELTASGRARGPWENGTFTLRTPKGHFIHNIRVRRARLRCVTLSETRLVQSARETLEQKHTVCIWLSWVWRFPVKLTGRRELLFFDLWPCHLWVALHRWLTLYHRSTCFFSGSSAEQFISSSFCISKPGLNTFWVASRPLNSASQSQMRRFTNCFSN